MTLKSPDKLKAKLESHIVKLQAGSQVTQRDLKAVLTSEEIEQMNGEWEAEKSIREHKEELWEQLSDYADMLDKADKVNNRYEKLSANASAPVNDKIALWNKTQSMYEKAFERLQELLCEDASLQVCLDRNVDFSAGSEPSLDAIGAPRYCFSRSEHAQKEIPRTINDIRISTLKNKLNEINNPVIDAEVKEENVKELKVKSAKLRSLMRRD
ncbi:hypothetical protein AEA42_13730 [Shewanella sp. Sh95]|uniref:hypothetical protein n=1 Tax=Shewanella sp. Sh95 TaxID=1689868 RepID=UPI0006DBBCCE|nr:hypothetical protein [Shewanella sp. Sh95]KPN76363.1 hypothetical protein AEA42_13730 [Shewanella sp. Sh95]